MSSSSLSGTLYVGVTDDIKKRIIQHKSGIFDGFTRKYKINRLMHLETYNNSKAAADREQQIKKFRREKKIALFAENNPRWKDLSSELLLTIGIPPLRQAQGRDFRKKSTTEANSLFHPGELEQQ